MLFVIWEKRFRKSISWLILWNKDELTIITSEMFSVFGFVKVSLMKYLSPIGFCLTLASNTEQSGGKISDHIIFVATWRTWAFACDLLTSDIAWVGHVRLGAFPKCMIWIFVAVGRAVWPVRPLAESSCDGLFSINIKKKNFFQITFAWFRSHSPVSRS